MFIVSGAHLDFNGNIFVLHNTDLSLRNLGFSNRSYCLKYDLLIVETAVYFLLGTESAYYIYDRFLGQDRLSAPDP